ncbi:hypothetical protein RclHR1_15650006 [Rhizophagus clarus]|uniref:NADP-dependent oxidoreductase domain-containing protein n=1 Tax=Rhizophagus clarus TaxID=94130 RepID=A0A2Z6R8H7_9GLOM|nr:hypothetical protein RclHR1_15650006 [Rhizophagus clarus]
MIYVIYESLDTANVYNFGESERFLGDYVSDKRSDVVVATKYTINTTAMQTDKRLNPNFGGNHRKSLVENLNESLKRLNMSYIDILYVHAFEYRTPIEEIMRSLDDVVRSGKVLYIAASDVPFWVLTRSNTIAELRGWRVIINYAEDEKKLGILDEVIAISKETPVQVAMNWVQQKPGITSSLIAAGSAT